MKRLVVLVALLSSILGVTATKAADDTTPPTLAAFDFNPKVVDTSTASKTITFTGRLVDSPAGVHNFNNSARFVSPSSGQFIDTSFDRNTRTSGNAQDGTYTYVATLPAFSEQGTWTLQSLTLIDDAFNLRQLTTGQVLALGFPTTFVQTGAGDTAPPTLAAFDFNPKVVDTSTASRTITFTGRLVDSPAGVNKFNNSARFMSPSSGQFIDTSFDRNTRTSGNAQDGIYTYVATLPAFSELGTWTLQSFTLIDDAFNLRQLTTGQVLALGFPTTFVQTGAGDTAPPTLATFDFNPKVVDTSTASKPITFTGRLVDSPAGVHNFNNSARFVSPSSGQFIDTSFDRNTRTSGNAQDGTYTYVATLPAFAEQGTWTLQSFTLIDDAFNMRQMTTAQVSTLGFPTTFLNTTIPLTPTTVAITPSQVPAVTGNSYVLRWSVRASLPAVSSASVAKAGAAPTGTVNVTVNGAMGCSAPVQTEQCTLTFDTPGVKTIVISYSGDANYSPSTASIQLEVSAGPTFTAPPTPTPSPVPGATSTPTPIPTPVLLPVRPVIPQVFQNPGVQGIVNGTRNPNPASTPQPRPAPVVAGVSDPPAAITIRPPSTGDAGLLP